MRRNRPGWFWVAVIGILAIAIVATLGLSAQRLLSQSNLCPISLTRKIGLPNTEGRIDHIDLSVSDQLAYVAALANDSLAVVNLRTGDFVRGFGGFHSPQGVLLVPNLKELYVSNGGDGTVDVLDASTFARVRTIQLPFDADNIRFDSRLLLVYVGYGGGGIAEINASTGQVLNMIGLFGHPESFQLETKGSRIFANVPLGNFVAVIDRRSASVIARWPLPNDTSGNYPMALDEANNRLFIGTKNPPSLLIIDTSSGQLVARLKISGDPDDISYSSNGCIYVSAGEGYVDVLRQSDANHYTLLKQIATAPGARTSLLVDSLGPLVVAAPGSPRNGSLYVFSTAGS